VSNAKLGVFSMAWLTLGMGACGGAEPEPASPRPTAAASQAPAPPPVAPERCTRPEPDVETKACLEEAKPAKCLVDLGRARLRRGEDQQAADALVVGIHRLPEQRGPYLELALLLQTNNRYDLSAAVLEQAKRFVPAKRRFLVHYLLASTHAARRRMPESVAELEAAHELNPNDPDVMLNLGLSYTKLSPRKLAKAKVLLERFAKEHCQGESGPAACHIALSTIERMQSGGAWPKERPPAITPAAYPPPTCATKAVEGEPDLPPIVLPTDPVRSGSMFTVWGASHHLRSKPHQQAVTGGPITVVGHVVAHNYAQAPACAIHRTGKPTPEDCRAPIPTFYIADTSADPTSYIPVMGWASNWANVYEMMRAADRDGAAAEVLDTYFGEALPNPIPAVGAEVAITGTYAFSYTAGTTGANDPRFGILTFQKMAVLKPAPKKASLPGITRK
jgi:hypothetical protein